MKKIEIDKRVIWEGYMGLEDLFSFRKLLGELYYDFLSETQNKKIIKKLDEAIELKMKEWSKKYEK